MAFLVQKQTFTGAKIGQNGTKTRFINRLKYFVKNVKIRSIKSCVLKFIRTRVPSNVYEMPYVSRKVTKRSGGRVKIEAITTFVK